jgi:hypothetical protein
MSYLSVLRSLEGAGTQGDKSDNIQQGAQRQVLSVLSLTVDGDFTAERTQALDETAHALRAIDSDDGEIAQTSISATTDGSVVEESSFVIHR